MSARGWYDRFGKRAFDLVGASLGAVVLLPVAVSVALVIRVSLGSPVLFRQRRPGLQGVPFVILKFRTMVEERRGAGDCPLADSDRLTAVGRVLRAASLDEIPELWNVIRGDMSLVGPRPLLMEYLPLYSADQARRHEVRPGITGLAQVSGRNGLSWKERFELDLQYVEHHSLTMDLAVLARTLREVCLRRGITQPGHATVDYFQGNAPSNG
jgi:lipopolysaccharide/colanic/teichoic acid biosynthesis glycosyltransferase